MADTTAKDYEKGIILKAEFDMYKVWRTIPSLLRYPPKSKDGSLPDPSEFAQSMGIENDVILDLVQLKNKKQFAERFNVSVETISDWEKKCREGNALQGARNWATDLTKNMILQMYNHAMKKGHPAMFKLWLQSIEDFKEVTKQEVEIPNLTEFNVSIKRRDPVTPAPHESTSVQNQS